MRPRSIALLLLLAAAGACTTLGPTPATTGLSARPMPRSGAEVQGAILPGHHLSQSVVEDPDSAGIAQLSAMFQADELTGLPGIVAGLRAFGEDSDTPVEAILGYRHTLGADELVALAGHVYGTKTSASENGASYRATRVGGELTGDVRVFANRWIEPHLFGSFNATHLSVTGTYCTDPEMRWAQDCAEPPDPPKPMTTTSIDGTFAAASVGAALELMRHRDSWFHGARVAFTAAGGMMPRVESGESRDATGYFAFGLSLAVGVGAPVD